MFKNSKIKMCIVCVILLSFTLFTVYPSFSASGVELKWKVDLGDHAKTFIGPLASDLDGDNQLEIVIVGGTEDYGSDGTVTALDGETGDIIWQVSPGGIGMHSPFEIADLNKDNLPEIVIAAKDGVLVLHGNDGSVYWRNKAAPSEENYLVVLDINADGYPEIFVSRGYGPYHGFDWISELSWDGNILRQTWVWHPCWGGLTIGDTNKDGIFELYQTDRNLDYVGKRDDGPDPYPRGGTGLRALDAETLTPLWNDPTLRCSSHNAMLADVDRNGVQDVIVGLQDGGIAVLNSMDGSVLTTNGKFRQDWFEDMSVHSQPTIFDLDGDRNLEMITANRSSVKIFDLYDWKLDTTLSDDQGFPLITTEPPKVGEITGDGKMDIIAVTGYTQYMYIYSYDPASKTYKIAYKIDGLLNANAFSLVQDVDNDNLNELILSSGTGAVYAFDTPGETQSPPPDSEIQFYSQNRLGAAEFVASPIPQKPVIKNPNPASGSLNQETNPKFSIEVVDFQGDLVDITFSTNTTGTWKEIASYNNVKSGSYSAEAPSMTQKGTKYYWKVSASDGVNANSATYFFSSYSDPPTQDKPTIASDDEKLVANNQTTKDSNGDAVTNIYNWIINDESMTNLLMPFDTRTSNNPLILNEIFADDFESENHNWNTETWNRDTSQKHSGTYSAHASDLVSKSIDTSGAESITISFWYRDHGIDDEDLVVLQFWDGSSYTDVFNLGNTEPEDMWHYYTVQTLEPRYLISSFKIRFAANLKSAGEELWIDDITLATQVRTKDYSGYGNHGTIHGVSWTENGIVGGAYTFDGKNDYIRINDKSALWGANTWPEITIEFWINPKTTRGTTILAKKSPSATYGSYMLGFKSDESSPANTLFFGITNSNGEWIEVSNDVTTALKEGNWYHVVATYKSGPGLSIYLNGTLQANAPTSGNIGQEHTESFYKQPLFIGQDGTGFEWHYFKGTLDELRIYKKALSPEQILQRYVDTNEGGSSQSTIIRADLPTGASWDVHVTPNDSFDDGQTRGAINDPPSNNEGNTNPAGTNRDTNEEPSQNDSNPEIPEFTLIPILILLIAISLGAFLTKRKLKPTLQSRR